MDKFTTLEGVAAPLKIINVDTDMTVSYTHLTLPTKRIV